MLDIVLINSFHNFFVKLYFNFFVKFSLWLLELIFDCITHYIFNNLQFKFVSIFQVWEFTDHTLDSIVV